MNVDGTRNLLHAALKAGIERFVHVSTFSVYGHPPDGDLDESAPRRTCNDDYSDSKLEAENIAFEHVHKFGLPVAIVQPTVVYGPYAPAWTVNVLNRLKSGRIILVNGGQGLCNAVYVDDVISGMLSAASRDQAIGEAFLLSAEEPITWRTFYKRFESFMGGERTVEMTASEARAYTNQAQRERTLPRQLVTLLRNHPEVLTRILGSPEGAALATLAPPSVERVGRRIVRGLVAKGPRNSRRKTSSPIQRIHPLSPWAIRRHESKIRVRIDKAKRILDYRPAFDFNRGMDLTEQWARWANLVESVETVQQ